MTTYNPIDAAAPEGAVAPDPSVHGNFCTAGARRWSTLTKSPGGLLVLCDLCGGFTTEAWPMIAYVVMHACTTGLFAWGMWKTEKKYASHSGNGSQSTGLLTKPQASDQKSGQEVAVAS